MTHLPAQLMLVGSVPLDTAEDVLNLCGERLGPFLNSLPDGEVGDRRNWVSRLHYTVFTRHPDLEIVSKPGTQTIQGRTASDTWRFRVRDGVTEIVFPEPGWRLGYAREAINSYFIFRTLRERGTIPQHLRFQVSMPLVNSVLRPHNVTDANDLAIMKRGYVAALQAEIANIAARIPHDDLALQFDLAFEVHDVYGQIPGYSASDAIERNLEEIRQFAPSVPPDVQLGYHFCFGTFGGWPMFSPPDIGPTVELANAVIGASERRVDWIHIPTVNRTDRAFYEPLSRLDPRGARVFLGIVHNMENFAERLAVARSVLPDFGLGAPCGLGRIPSEAVPRILEEHLVALEAAAAN